MHEGEGCAACLQGTFNPRLAQIVCSNCTVVVGTYSLNFGATSNETFSTRDPAAPPSNINNGILYKGSDNPQFSCWYSTATNGLHWARVEFTDEAFVTGIQLASGSFQHWYNHNGYFNAAVTVGNDSNVLSTQNSICKIFTTAGMVDESLRTFDCDSVVRGKFIFISNRFSQGGNGQIIGIYELTVQGYRVNGASCTACTAGTFKDTLGSAACTSCPEKIKTS
jgi:hypothetical protein